MSVTLEIETVGSPAVPNVPIVSTGPPPRMTVAAAPAPTRLMLLPIETPPAKVPGPTWIVSPSLAASTAA